MGCTMWPVNAEGSALRPDVSGGAREGTSGASGGERIATLRRALTLGIHLLDIAEMYTWGLHRETIAFRAGCGAQLAAALTGGRRSSAPRRGAHDHERRAGVRAEEAAAIASTGHT